MRNISFALTTEQVRNHTKTVTRRLAWKNLKLGTLLQPVVKAQGLKKGERVEKIGGPIRVVSVRREFLDRLTCPDSGAYGSIEVALEGFAYMTPADFVAFFCEQNGCRDDVFVTRIEFEYVEAEP